MLALDYGHVRTGVAVSDETGSIARPLTVVARAGSQAGLETVGELVNAEGAASSSSACPSRSTAPSASRPARCARSSSACAGRSTYRSCSTTNGSRRRWPAGAAAPSDLDARAAALILEDYLSST